MNAIKQTDSRIAELEKWAERLDKSVYLLESQRSGLRVLRVELMDALLECVVSIEHRASREEMESTVERARATLTRAKRRNP